MVHFKIEHQTFWEYSFCNTPRMLLLCLICQFSNIHNVWSANFLILELKIKTGEQVSNYESRGMKYVDRLPVVNPITHSKNIPRGRPRKLMITGTILEGGMCFPVLYNILLKSACFFFLN